VAAPRLLAIIRSFLNPCQERNDKMPGMRPLNPFFWRVAKKIKSLFTAPPEEPGDPYALVGAPVRPKLPTLTAKAAAVPERYCNYDDESF
jgi:hypothetical protein